MIGQFEAIHNGLEFRPFEATSGPKSERGDRRLDCRKFVRDDWCLIWRATVGGHQMEMGA
jgi:hypothetical protein